jgi:hypothetical protein
LLTLRKGKGLTITLIEILEGKITIFEPGERVFRINEFVGSFMVSFVDVVGFF